MKLLIEALIYFYGIAFYFLLHEWMYFLTNENIYFNGVLFYIDLKERFLSFVVLTLTPAKSSSSLPVFQ